MNRPTVHPTTLHAHAGLARGRASARRSRRPGRRGVAMILVMIALGSATVLSTSYLSARDTTPAVAANTVSATSADWAARSAAAAAVAILQTQANWMADADPTTLVKDFDLAGAKVAVVVTDLEGNPPDSRDTDLLLTATATAGAVRKVTQRVVRYQAAVTPNVAVDPALGEFAVFGVNGISFDSTSGLIPWNVSPIKVAGKKVKIGTGFTASGSLSIDSNSDIKDAALYVGKSASGGLKAKVNDAKLLAGAVLPVDVPAAPASLPASIAARYAATNFGSRNYISSLMSTTLSSDGRYDDMIVDLGAVLTLDSTRGADYSFRVLKIDNASSLRIKGAVRVEVRSLEVLDRSNIELFDDTSSVEFYVRGSVMIDDSGVGIPTPVARDPSRVYADVSTYVSPDRVRVNSLRTADNGQAANNITIRDASTAVMSLHMPEDTVIIEDSSEIIGRVTGASVVVKTNSRVIYDPALDNNSGFSSADGPLYDNAGTPRGTLAAALGSFNTALGMQALPSYVQSLTGAVTLVAPSVGATPRRDDRAVMAEWPSGALAFEQSTTGTTETSGMLVTTKVKPLITAVSDTAGGVLGAIN